MIHIYKLINPLTNNPYYVGATANINNRLNSHISTPSCNTGKELKLAKIKPIIEVIVSVKEEKAIYTEIYWINRLRKEGYCIENKTITSNRKSFKNNKKRYSEQQLMALKSIGELIKKEMGNRGWSLYKLTKESKVTTGQLHSMINATKSYTIDSFLKVFNALGINILE